MLAISWALGCVNTFCLHSRNLQFHLIVRKFIQTETLTDLLDLLTRMPGLCIKQTDFNPSASVALFDILRSVIQLNVINMD